MGVEVDNGRMNSRRVKEREKERSILVSTSCFHE